MPEHSGLYILNTERFELKAIGHLFTQAEKRCLWASLRRKLWLECSQGEGDHEHSIVEDFNDAKHLPAVTKGLHIQLTHLVWKEIWQCFRTGYCTFDSGRHCFAARSRSAGILLEGDAALGGGAGKANLRSRNVTGQSQCLHLPAIVFTLASLWSKG